MDEDYDSDDSYNLELERTRESEMAAEAVAQPIEDDSLLVRASHGHTGTLMRDDVYQSFDIIHV